MQKRKRTKKGARFAAHSLETAVRQECHPPIMKDERKPESEHGASGDVAIRLWVFLHAYHERVVGIGAIGASHRNNSRVRS